MAVKDQIVTSSPAREDKLRTLIDAFRLVSVSLDLTETLHYILTALRVLIRYDAAGIYIFDPAKRTLKGYELVGYEPGVTETETRCVGKGIIGQVLESGEAFIVSDVDSDPNYLRARESTRSELAAPLLGTGGRVIGVINLESDTRDHYAAEDLELLTLFASLATISVEKANLHRELLEKRRLESELRLAGQVMDALLPTAPADVRNFEIAGRTVSSTEVGGDYYDFIRVADGRLGVVIADVSGKGIPAALIMASFRAYTHALLGNDFSLRAVFKRLNHLLAESTEERHFVTAFYGELDDEGRRMFYLNAGHNPPLLLRREEPARWLSTGGIPLGVQPGAGFSEDIIQLTRGDVLALYTDGVTEAENDAGEPYGLERLERLVRHNLAATAQGICAAIVEDAKCYLGSHQRSDDMTVVVIKAK